MRNTKQLAQRIIISLVMRLEYVIVVIGSELFCSIIGLLRECQTWRFVCVFFATIAYYLSVSRTIDP